MVKNDEAPQPLKKTVIAISFAWLIGAASLVYATYPDTGQSARLVAGEDVAVIKPIVRAASAVTTSAQAATPAANLRSFDFIVKFKPDNTHMNACATEFRTDKAKAREMFSDWAASQDAFEDTKLKKVSYSGEMIVTWEIISEEPLSGALVAKKLESLKADPSVKYADKDSQITVQEQ